MRHQTLKRILQRYDLLEDPETTDDYYTIINDYMIIPDRVVEIIQRAFYIKKENQDFNHHSYIINHLIQAGKEKAKSRNGKQINY